jgi:PTS system nitrogen regulatory IIA component
MQLTVREAAALLRATERQVYRWVDDGEIPFQRVNNHVRFNRTDLLEWATSRRLPISLEAFDAGLDPEDRAPSLAQAIRVGGVHRDVPGTDREAVLHAVVERAPMPPGVDREFMFEILVAREQTSSTAIGQGIAIPHVRQPAVVPGAPATVTVSYLAAPVGFGAPDGLPVRVVFFIISPTVRTHLQMLAHVARALHDAGFRAALERRAATEELAAEAARLEVTPMAPAPATGRRDDDGD